MKKFSESPIACKAKCALKNLSDIRIKSKYDMSVSLYDAKSPETTECTHVSSGEGDHSLIKLLAVVGVVSVIMSAICCVCSLFKD